MDLFSMSLLHPLSIICIVCILFRNIFVQKVVWEGVGGVYMLPCKLIDMAQLFYYRLQLCPDVGLVVGTYRLYHRNIIDFLQPLCDILFYLYHRPNNMHLSIEELLYRKHCGKLGSETEIHHGGFHQIIEMVSHGNQLLIVFTGPLEEDTSSVAGAEITVELSFEGFGVLFFVYNCQIYIQILEVCL